MSESTHVKMPHCWKSHALAQILSFNVLSDRVGGRTLTVELKTANGTDLWDLGGQWVGRYKLLFSITSTYIAVTCDFQQWAGILTCVDSDQPVQPPFNLRNAK